MSSNLSSSMPPGDKALNLLSKLARKGAFVRLNKEKCDVDECSCDLFIKSNNLVRQKVMVRRELVESALRDGLLAPGARVGDWRLSKLGVKTLKRARSIGDGGVVQREISVTAARLIEQPITPEAARTEFVNEAESPLGWLRRRKGKNGSPLINEAQFMAGERLRADFWYAQMTPRVTANWSEVSSSRQGKRTAGEDGTQLSDNVVAAQQRVRKALERVGPELAGVLIDVCCHLKGLETAEKEAGWPQRSGKVVLILALNALARYYGLIGQAADAGAIASRLRHWGTSDYKPVITNTVERND